MLKYLFLKNADVMQELLVMIYVTELSWSNLANLV